MTLMQRLKARLCRFHQDEAGSYTVETLIALPFLVWGMVGTLTYIDAYRTKTMNLRITYAIADQLSRLEKPLDATYVDGLGRIQTYLAPTGYPTNLRITSVTYHETAGQYLVNWSDVAQSEAGGTTPPLIGCTNFDLIEHRIPLLADGDSVLIVETWLDYTPPFNVGIDARRFDTDVAVAPRWTTQITHKDFPANICSVNAAQVS